MKLEDIRQLMEAFEVTELTSFRFTDGHSELELKKGGETTVSDERPAMPSYVKKESPEGTAASPASSRADAAGMKPGAERAAGKAEDKKEEADGMPLKAPLAGVFYCAAKPDEKPYVHVGSVVRKGQTVGLMEAMKMMSEIPSPCDGTVTAIQIKNGEFSEFGRTLMVIEEKS